MPQLNPDARSSSVATTQRTSRWGIPHGAAAAVVLLLVSVAAVSALAGSRATAQPQATGTKRGDRPQHAKPSRKLQTNQAAKRSAGSASVLKGSVCLYHLFVDDKHSTWSPTERDSVRLRLGAAVDFLSLQARRYKVRFDVVQLYRDRLKYEADLPTDMFAPPAWTEAVFRLTGATSGNDLVAELKKKHKVEQVMLFIHIDKKATSYSLCYYHGTDPKYAAERAVCFNRYTDGRRVAAATYAHEILHGFGAGELYFPFDSDDRRKQLARKWFPDDVMLRVDYDIRRLSIGEFTAFRIGWLQNIDSKQRVFED